VRLGQEILIEPHEPHELNNMTSMTTKTNYQNMGWTAGDRLQIIAGPCAIEGETMAMDIAEHLIRVCSDLDLPLIFKGSYRKANRSRIDSFTGIGDDKALAVLAKVKKEFGVAVTTDVHTAEEARWAGDVVDVLQIPAFLCRQTDLLIAAAQTGRVVNVKKGQFLSAESMQFAVGKVRDAGNEKAWLTERGTTFGYQDLVLDFRGIPVMQQYAPTIVDLTHSLQQPNQTSGVTGGRPELIAHMARTSVAAGADGVFIETHPDPSKAKSDGANMLALDRFADLAAQMATMRAAFLQATATTK
jgi:2-dehydro-3-deoxyphosphooctonate aldolase (KDO 8-P synthase)